MAAETIRRTFEPGNALSPEKVQEVHTIFIQLFDQLIDIVKERIQKETES